MKALIHFGLGLVLVCFCKASFALEYKPFPEAKITNEQWQAYYNEAIEKFGESAREFPQQNLIVLHDQAGHTHYAFTQPGHPAHPAWITRLITEKDGEVFIQQIGYFAAEEAPFAELFQNYLDLNEKIKAEIRANQPPIKQ